MAETGTTDMQVVVFRLGREEYAVSITAVKDVQSWIQPTPVPESPPVVEGVINLRGEIIPVIDLGKLFRTERQNANTEARIMVMEVEGEKAGFVVDDVTEVRTLTPDAVAPPSPVLHGGASGSRGTITGIAKLGEGRLVILVDAVRILKGLQLSL